MLTSLSATHIQARSVGTPSQAVNLPSSAMTTMQMLAPTDPNAAMQNMMQVGMLPVAPAMASAHSGSALDVLTLNSADLPESHITALAGLLAESGQADGSSLSQDQQSSADGQGSGFAQTLAAKAQAADAANRQTAEGVNRSMSEVYEQLSDKLSTEMAARMHEQLNAGQWKMKFGLKPSHLGAVDVELEMREGKLTAMINTDNATTQQLLSQGSSRLREALNGLGWSQAAVHIGQGQSPSAHTGHGQGQNNGPTGHGLNSGESANDLALDDAPPRPTASSNALLDIYA